LAPREKAITEEEVRLVGLQSELKVWRKDLESTSECLHS
jgi:hypothetical protein